MTGRRRTRARCQVCGKPVRVSITMVQDAPVFTDGSLGRFRDVTANAGPGETWEAQAMCPEHHPYEGKVNYRG